MSAFPKTFLERHYVRFMDAVKPGVAPARLLEADDNARKRKYPTEVVKFTSPNLRSSHEVYVRLNEDVVGADGERLWDQYNKLRSAEPVPMPSMTEEEWRVANE